MCRSLRVSIALVLAAVTGIPRGAHAGEPARFCFSRHLREAIALNTTRRPLYAALTAGQSKAVSDTLIGTERLAIVGALYFDLQAAAFQRRGVPLMCEEFVDMSLAPAFRAHVDLSVPSPAALPEIDTWALGRHFFDAYRARGFAALATETERAIAALAGLPQHHCMLRHVLESMRRAATLAPEQERHARAAGLAGASTVSWQYLAAQVFVLPQAHAMDVAAFPIQVRGIPIICQDVPPIPARECHGQTCHTTNRGTRFGKSTSPSTSQSAASAALCAPRHARSSNVSTSGTSVRKVASAR